MGVKGINKQLQNFLPIFTGIMLTILAFTVKLKVLKLFIPFLWREAVQQVIYMEPFAAFHPFVALFSSATAL